MRKVLTLVMFVATVGSLVAQTPAAQGSQWRTFRVTPDSIEDLGGGFIPAPVIFGDDVGFQLTPGAGRQAGVVSGRLVVKIDGQWLVATTPMTLGPLGR